MHRGPGPVLVRIAGIVGGLLVAGLLLRLIVAMLSPILPRQLSQGLVAGWDLLYGMVLPAAAPIFAVLIVALIIWAIVGRLR
jgi:hypothetical protein